MNEVTTSLESLQQARVEGRRIGFGIAALALGCISYLTLLGAEKAILAIVLGAMACARPSSGGRLARRFGVAAIVLGAVFIVSLAVLLIVYWDKVRQLAIMLQQLS